MKHALIAVGLLAALAAPVPAAETKSAAQYLEEAAHSKGAVRTASGAVVVPLKAGTGDRPTATDTVQVHYTGTLLDGKIFDSSIRRGTPAEFPLGRVIRCWTEGIQKMRVGGKAKLVCPAETAYGRQGAPPVVPPNSVLTFEVELLSIVR